MDRIVDTDAVGVDNIFYTEIYIYIYIHIYIYIYMYIYIYICISERKRVGKSSSTFEQLLISVFNLPFQIVINHPITSNNCNNIVQIVLVLHSDTLEDVLEEEKPYTA